MCSGRTERDAGWAVGQFGIGTPLLTYFMFFKPTWEFVWGFDPALSRKVRGLLLISLAGYAVPVNLILVPGICLALWGRDLDTQDLGTSLFAVGGMTGMLFLTVGLKFATKPIESLILELGVESRSGKALANLRKAVSDISDQTSFDVIFYLIVLVVPPANALSGTIFVYYLTLFVFSCLPSVVLYEGKRLGLFGDKTVPKVVPSRDDGANRVHRPKALVSETARVAAAALEVDDAAMRLVRSREERGSTVGGVKRMGVSLQMLRDFSYEWQDDKQTLTAADMCTLFVKPATAATRTSLVVLLQEAQDEQGVPWCGIPTHFVSYAWSYKMALLLDILEQYELENPPAKGETHYYFIDQLSLNQHTFVGVTAEADEVALQKRIIASLTGQMINSGHVLVCLHPWHNPVPLRRSWCLFELYVALEAKMKLSMCYGKEDADALHAAVVDSTFDAERVIGEIRAQDASAMKLKDKQMIMETIDSSLGLERFNTDMQAYLLKATKSAVTTVLAQKYGSGQTALARRDSHTKTAAAQTASEQVLLNVS